MPPRGGGVIFKFLLEATNLLSLFLVWDSPFASVRWPWTSGPWGLAFHLVAHVFPTRHPRIPGFLAFHHCDKHCSQKTMLGGKGLSSPNSFTSIMKAGAGSTELETGKEAKPWRSAAYQFALCWAPQLAVLVSQDHLSRHGPTHSGMSLSHHSLNKEIPHRLNYKPAWWGDICSGKVPSSQMTVACYQVEKKNLAHLGLHHPFIYEWKVENWGRGDSWVSEM